VNLDLNSKDLCILSDDDYFEPFSTYVNVK